ncbi:MAG: hypothetical protein IJ949_05660 [Oscillospiraceae bacterium]|nr:hypothetical protein [Oscillospiraceae bacterium]
MNENEVITALEDAVSRLEKTGIDDWELALSKDTTSAIIDIIKSLKAENEELKCRNQNLTSDLTSAKAEIENLIKIIQHRNSENGKLIIELQAMRGAANSYKAENERLKNSDAVSREYVSICDKEIEDWKSLCNDYKSELLDVAKRIKHIASEARKELAERLKAKLTYKGKSTKYGDFTWGDIKSYELDNLLAEMESERG